MFDLAVKYVFEDLATPPRLEAHIEASCKATGQPKSLRYALNLHRGDKGPCGGHYRALDKALLTYLCQDLIYITESDSPYLEFNLQIVEPVSQ